MVSSVIKKSQLEGARRLDAEYYQPELLSLSSRLYSQKLKLLKDFTEKVFSGPFGSTLKSDSYQSAGIPFIRIGDIADVFISRNSLIFISPEEHKRIHSTYLRPGDIVFSKIGTVGRLSVISDDLGEVNISENNIGIRFSKISPELRVYLLFFLLSKYGQTQILRKASGNIQLKLNVSDIETISIPEVSDRVLKDFLNLYKQLIDYKKESEILYFQAENLLSEGLKIKDLNLGDEAGFVVMLSEIKENGRCDAEYFQPKYKKLAEYIKKNCNGVLLGDLVTMKKGIEPGAEEYQEPSDAEAMEGKKGKQFIRVSSLSKFGVNDSDQKYLSEELYQKLKGDFEPKKGEILLTKDASPGIAYVLKENIEGIMAGGILRLKLKNKEIEDEYLSLCVNSVVGQMQAERDAGGSVIAHWKPEQIKNILIPILPKPTQQKIADLARQSHESRKKAKQLLEEAKRNVEELIEKGGKA